MEENTFMRYEKKYLLTPGQMAGLTERMAGRMAPDRYGMQTIANVYYDAPDFALIRSSLQGPVYKEKLRLRSYGRAAYNGEIFAEIKKKWKGVVYKRRAPMKLYDAERLLQTGIALMPLNQVQQEIRYMAGFWQAEPKAYIAYDREAYVDAAGGGLRLTFDRSIRCRTEALTLSGPTEGEQLLDEGITLMEIKIPGAFPLWLSRALSEMEIFPTSFSKYGQYYLRIAQAQEGRKHHVA